MNRRYLIAGLLIWLPIWVTLLVLKFLADLFDRLFGFIPQAYQPDKLIGFHIPGLGLLFALIIVFVTGMLITHIVGHRLVELWDRLVSKIPLVSSIHHAVKSVASSFLSSSEESFRQVYLVEYPRKGLWSIAFQTSSGFTVADEMVDDDLLTVFVPTTPNPTSGYLLLVPRSEAVKMDMSVDAALRMVISLGTVLPVVDKTPGQATSQH